MTTLARAARLVASSRRFILCRPPLENALTPIDVNRATVGGIVRQLFVARVHILDRDRARPRRRIPLKSGRLSGATSKKRPLSRIRV
jgi:hypothetical protein